MKPYFITGAGTGVGKTLVVSAVAHQLKKAGRQVRALKPVISGFSANAMTDSDTGLLLAAQGLEPSSLEAISPWRFMAPLSPDMAAADEGRAIDFKELLAFCSPQSHDDYLLIEGVGGVMAPLDETHTVLDWMAALGFPVILVTGSYLGSLSHMLTAARVVSDAGLKLHSVIIAESESSPVPPARMAATLSRFLPRKTRILSIDRLDSCHELWKDVPDLLSSLFNEHD